MKTLIICESKHHGNTKKLADAIAQSHPVEVCTVQEAAHTDLDQYDVIGLASGIAFGKFYPNIELFAKNRLPADKKVFLLYTSGSGSRRPGKGMEKIIRQKNGTVLGTYNALGYDTFGPFKLAGGIAKGHPDAAELEGAVRFYELLAEK